MANNWRLICSLHLFSGTFPLVIIILCWFLVLIQYNTEVLCFFHRTHSVVFPMLRELSCAIDRLRMTSTLHDTFSTHDSYPPSIDRASQLPCAIDGFITLWLTRWPTVSRGGAYCGGHLAAQLVFGAMLCIMRNMLLQDVCPSVCPTHVGILSKRLNIDLLSNVFAARKWENKDKEC